ncbi:MAG: dihydrolipoamide acetyltransferase family protein [Actinomycetota bacterium]
MFEFKMPQLGETVLEATITRWLKVEGDAVQEDEPLVEVSTDKVDSEIPSPFSGLIARILVAEGETVPVGAVLVQIDPDGKPAGRTPAESVSMAPSVRLVLPPEPPAEPPAALAALPADPPVSDSPFSAPTSAGRTDSPGRELGSDGRPVPSDPVGAMSSVLSPLVRRLAIERGVKLETVVGTGSGGRITRDDVLAAAPSAPAPSAPAPSAPAPGAPAPGAGHEELVVVSPMRRSIAEHMLASITGTARAWNTIEVDLTRIGRLRAIAGPAFKDGEGFSLTWMPFVCMAASRALLKFPQLNSTWNGDGTITRKHYVNLGIAVALENGLIVPVVKRAEGMNLMGLARAVRDLAERARTKRLSPDDVQGGTFTITNPGGFGSIMSVPIINKGQAAILAFDAVVKRPVVVTDSGGTDSIGIRQMSFLSMSWDHRIVDGAEAAKFLAYLRSLLEEGDFTADLGGLLPQ